MTTHIRYPTIFSPLSIGAHEMRNRILQAPMSVCYADEHGFVTDAVVEHYARRAQGGVGMVIVENFAVSESGRQLPKQGMISDAVHLPGLARLAEAIKARGSLAVMQLVHSGRYAGPWHEYEARRRLAPSAISFPLPPDRTVTPQEITPDEIADAIAAFAVAARLAEQAGFDGIEIHGGQGFLIASFLSPRMNARRDEWGGSFDNRCRFAIAVLKAVREAVGEDMVVGFHLMSDELMPGGWSIDDAVALSAMLEDRVDFVMPISATFEALRAQANLGLFDRPQFQHEHAKRLTKELTIPVFTNGGIRDADTAERLLAAGEAAAVGLARPLLADPDWVAKVSDGRDADIRRCSCQPPKCLMTQLTSAVCASWPEDVQSKGYLGLGD